MMTAEHQIVQILFDDDQGCARWTCRCGYEADGYSDVTEARYAAAEHQLPADVQLDIERHCDTIEQWRGEIIMNAYDAAAADPDRWAWYTALEDQDGDGR